MLERVTVLNKTNLFLKIFWKLHELFANYTNYKINTKVIYCPMFGLAWSW